MAVLSETAFAKINLALHVRGRRDDGYHTLDTLFAFVDAGDHLTAELADRTTLDLFGPYSQDIDNTEDNLVLQTAHAVARAFDVSAGAQLTLDKRLPVASGIGGGSADAAATARLLNRLWSLQASDAELASILAFLGADIPACIASQTVRGQGTGTELAPISSDISGMPVLLVNPNKALSTAAVFAAWNGQNSGALINGSAREIALQGCNDLQSVAITLCPDIDAVLTSLAAQGPVLTRMSGSGATCFALYSGVSERDAAQISIAAANPDWWTLAGVLR